MVVTLSNIASLDVRSYTEFNADDIFVHFDIQKHDLALWVGPVVNSNETSYKSLGMLMYCR